MRRPIKPFAVETRRVGRKPQGKFPSGAPAPGEGDKAPNISDPHWPSPQEDQGYAAALRAADALFARPAQSEPVEAASSAAPAPATVLANVLAPAEPDSAAPPASAPAEPPRRILQSLTDEDHIARMLAEEEARRPRRGRKPRDADEPAPLARPIRQAVADPDVLPEQEQAEADAVAAPAPARIPGYVRGLIYARYARRDAPGPGQKWRQRGLKPRW